MRINSPSVVIVGACVMALFPERVLAASISVHTATIVLAVIAGVYITISTLLAIAVCWLLCGKRGKVLPASCPSPTTTQESIELQLSPPHPFNRETPKESAFPSQKVTITGFSTIEEGDPYTVAKQQPQQSVPATAADTTPRELSSLPQADTTPRQLSSLPRAETKEDVPAGSTLPGSYLGLDAIFQTSSIGTSESDDTVFDKHPSKPEAVAESSFDERRKQAKQKRKAGRTDSTKPLMRSSVSSEAGPDTPVGESPDITTNNRGWSSKPALPPIGDTLYTAIRERPRPGSANTSISTTSAGFRMPGAMGQTPPHEGGAADLQGRLRKPSITLL